MARTKKVSFEENEKRMNETAIRDTEKAIVDGILSTPPKRRVFKVGQRIVYGAHKEVYVREVYKNGMYYLIEIIGVVRTKGAEPRNELHIMKWNEIQAYGANQPTAFTKEEKYYIRALNSPLSSLLNMAHANHAGVDFDVDYQREHVWTKKDKIALLDSIFNNIDIGKFVFIERSYSVDKKLYEILDGKQRLTALLEFYEDRLKYRGYYFSELSFRDQYKFTDMIISYGYLENPSKEAIFETFIKLNTCGKPMANKHINHVKYLLKEFKEIKQQVSDKLEDDGY
jgi:hypothetical protein